MTCRTAVGAYVAYNKPMLRIITPKKCFSFPEKTIFLYYLSFWDTKDYSFYVLRL